MEKRGFNWVCLHCRNNPTALPPYVEMKPFPVNGLTKTKLYKYAKINKLRAECVFCQAMRKQGLKPRTPPILNGKRFS